MLKCVCTSLSIATAPTDRHTHHNPLPLHDALLIYIVPYLPYIGGIEREPFSSDEHGEDLFALLLDIVEEGDDKCVREPDSVPYEFMSLAAQLSGTFLPAHHDYRIKLVLCKFMFGHEESEVLEEFQRLNVPLDLLLRRFAAANGVPFHTTGRDVDDNVEWDIVRNWR